MLGECKASFTPWSIKMCHFYFLNSSVQHWPILIIIGMQHQKKTWCKWLYFWPPHLILSLHYLVICRLLSLLFASGVNVCHLHSRWRGTFWAHAATKEDAMWHVWFFLDKIVANRQKNFADCVMVKFEFLNCAVLYLQPRCHLYTVL